MGSPPRPHDAGVTAVTATAGRLHRPRAKGAEQTGIGRSGNQRRSPLLLLFLLVLLGIMFLVWKNTSRQGTSLEPLARASLRSANTASRSPNPLAPAGATSPALWQRSRAPGEETRLARPKRRRVRAPSWAARLGGRCLNVGDVLCDAEWGVGCSCLLRSRGRVGTLALAGIWAKRSFTAASGGGSCRQCPLSSPLKQEGR